MTRAISSRWPGRTSAAWPQCCRRGRAADGARDRAARLRQWRNGGHCPHRSRGDLAAAWPQLVDEGDSIGEGEEADRAEHARARQSLRIPRPPRSLVRRQSSSAGQAARGLPMVSGKAENRARASEIMAPLARPRPAHRPGCTWRWSRRRFGSAPPEVDAAILPRRARRALVGDLGLDRRHRDLDHHLHLGAGNRLGRGRRLPLPAGRLRLHGGARHHRRRLMPWYFRGELVTVYALLQTRFGPPVKALAASLFVSCAPSRTAFGSSSRLRAAAVFEPLGVSGAIVGLGLVMIAFTSSAASRRWCVIEVAQLVIYVGGALAVVFVLVGESGSTAPSRPARGRQVPSFDFSFDLSKAFTFWSGLIGGTFSPLSTHGTDQYLVQRYLCTDARAARRRRCWRRRPWSSCSSRCSSSSASCSSRSIARAHRSPRPIRSSRTHRQPPAGRALGLVIAAILAAALSSSLNSIAATVVSDLMRPRDDGQAMRWSRVITVVAGIAQDRRRVGAAAHRALGAEHGARRRLAGQRPDPRRLLPRRTGAPPTRSALIA